MVKKLNKKIIHFIIIIISVFCLNNVFTLNANALDITSTTEVASIEGFSFENSVGLSYSRTGVKPFVFSSATTGDLNVQSRLLAPQITLSRSGIKDRFWTLYLDVYVYTQEEAYPVVNCLNTASGAKYVIDSCDVISGGSYVEDFSSYGQWYYPTGSTGGAVSNNGMTFGGETIVTHYILALAGHVSNSDDNKTMNFRGDFLQISKGPYVVSISLSNVRFFTSESAESQAINNQTEQQQEHYEEQQNQAEQQGQDAQDNSDETQSQVDNKTQNLFSFITSFFGAFTNASPSNCNFDWGLADKGFGVIDMCQTNIPIELQSILSIVSILIVVPMVLWLINSIVGAFKEFQQ